MSVHGDSGDEEVMFKGKEVEEVSEPSQDETENVLNEVNGMSPETLKVYLEHKQKIQMDKIKMELEKEKMHQRYLLEAEKQKFSFELEMEKLKVSTESNANLSVKSEQVKYKGPKVPNLKEGDDIDSYLYTFEKLAEAYTWPRDTRATRLAALLTGKALEAFARMDHEDSQDYDKVKKAILRRYELTSEAYRKKFRSSRRTQDETFAEWSFRISRYNDQWWEAEDLSMSVVRSTEVKEVRDLLIREQLLESSPDELRTWLKERKPNSVKEMVQLGDQYIVSHVSHESDMEFQSSSFDQQKQRREPGNGVSKETRKCYNCDKRGHIASECRMPKPSVHKVGV